MWQKIKSIHKIKTFYFKGRSIHLIVRTGINCENTIAIKYHYPKRYRFWSLWLMLWFINLGFAYSWRKKRCGRRLNAGLATYLKKDWHNWETFCFELPEDKPNLAYEMKKCKICGKIISVTVPRERINR